MGLEKTNRQESKVENVKMFKEISKDKKNQRQPNRKETEKERKRQKQK